MATRYRESRHPRARAHSLAYDGPLTASTCYPPSLAFFGFATPTRAHQSSTRHRTRWEVASRGLWVPAHRTRSKCDLWGAKPRRLHFEAVEP